MPSKNPVGTGVKSGTYPVDTGYNSSQKHMFTGVVTEYFTGSRLSIDQVKAITELINWVSYSVK